MNKPPLWLLLSSALRPDLPYVIATVAWIAKRRNALLEAYVESARDGMLFATGGSTVLGGGHYQSFNYLHAAFEVSYILIGEPQIFASSIRTFRGNVLSEAEEPLELYTALLGGEVNKRPVIYGPAEPLKTTSGEVQIAPYLYPEILFQEAIGFPIGSEADLPGPKTAFCLPPETVVPKGMELILPASPESSFASLTSQIARRWQHRAQGVAFGDPAVILSQLASHCREERVALYAPCRPRKSSEVEASGYAESVSDAVEETARIALEIGNRVVVGRQTGDGDILAWSRHGVCVQIVDPNRPVFPVVAETKHSWADGAQPWLEGEPDDAQLEKWADEGRVLSTLVWHSGEVAHNEAMLAVCDLAGWAGLKMGVGVHAQRYETAAQGWELLQIARDRGGVQGLIEPILHSGGLGVMAESECPAEIMQSNIAEALVRIKKVAGQEGCPRGYYAFLDTDLATLSRLSPEAYRAAELNGLEYFLSSAHPGRNRILYRSGETVVFNQSCRVIHAASPFVRLSHAEDLETWPGTSPGWRIGVLDAPVVAFGPYVWQKGHLFMELAKRLCGSHLPNVLPHTIGRYARLLAKRGLVPVGTPKFSTQS